MTHAHIAPSQAKGRLLLAGSRLNVAEVFPVAFFCSLPRARSAGLEDCVTKEHLRRRLPGQGLRHAFLTLDTVRH